MSCGRGVESRDVICVKKLGQALAVVGDENCDAANAPERTQPCERAECLAAWYMTAWTEVRHVPSRPGTCSPASGETRAYIKRLVRHVIVVVFQCSRSCDTGSQTREVKCLTSLLLCFSARAAVTPARIRVRSSV